VNVRIDDARRYGCAFEVNDLGLSAAVNDSVSSDC